MASSQNNGDVIIGGNDDIKSTTTNNSGSSNNLNSVNSDSSSNNIPGKKKSTTRSDNDTGLSDNKNNGEVAATNANVQPRPISPSQRSADYKKLIQYGLDEKVSAKLDDIYSTGT